MSVGFVPAEHLLQASADLADRRPARAALMDRSSRLPWPDRAHSVSASSAAFRRHRIAVRPQFREPIDLRFADGRLSILSTLSDRRAPDVLVEADDGLHARVDISLGAGRRLRDPHLGDTGLDRLGHTAELLALDDVRPGPVRQLVGQPFDKVAAAPRIDHGVGVGLLLQEQLRVAGDAGREVGRQGQRLVERVGVQALRVAVGRAPSPRCRCG